MMKKYVVVSTNNNPDYMFYAPYIEKAWNSLGWNLCIMVTQGVNIMDLKTKDPNTIIVQLPKVEGLRDETIAQTGRLYAANYLPMDALIMTSDMDLLPLQDYWKPNYEDITVYGHDLTWFNFYPMGYIAMTGAQWAMHMNCTYNTAHDMERDAKEIGIAYSNDWDQWWNHDWTLVTKRLKPKESLITFINRGQVNIANATLAKGRVDRYNWDETRKQYDLIDAHCENQNVLHESKLPKFLELFESVYGKL